MNLIFMVYLFNEFWLTYQSKIMNYQFMEMDLRKFRTQYYFINIDRIWREHLQKRHYYARLLDGEVMDKRNPL
jgi:hypothetical protein